MKSKSDIVLIPKTKQWVIKGNEKSKERFDLKC